MANTSRLEQIVTLVDEHGFLTVSELSAKCMVSEMTIRRDLATLDQHKRLHRTYGGAASLRAAPPLPAVGLDASPEESPNGRPDKLLVDQVDVLIATALNPQYDGLLLNSLGSKKDLPIIAESLSVQREETVVAVDNFLAGQALGEWAGNYARTHWDGQASLLDLSYYLSNTQARSRGFLQGLRSVLPTAEVVLSLDAQSRFDTAYQLTRDALAVHPQINLIFAINDITAWGAIQACRDLGLPPEGIMVLPFGLEGDTLKNALIAGEYSRAGLAMFPEIVGPTCIEAAIAAYNHRPLPPQLVTPFAVLTAGTLPELYTSTPSGWSLNWEAARGRLALPLPIDLEPPSTEPVPACIGFIIPFSEHEWYRNLMASMSDYAGRRQIKFETIDVHQSLRDEIELRRREIARLAAEQVQPGDVILIDGGPIAAYLAEALSARPEARTGVTVITNSMLAFEILNRQSDLVLISTGGAFRHSSQVLVGPTAERALGELRADKLFLMVTGITLNFGLSHTNISEVTIKQAMIRSARKVILLADHTFFGQESLVQVAPLSVVDQLITDDALPASARLDLTKLGIEIILASIY